MFFYYDWTYILVLIGAGLSLWASSNVNGLIRKYQQVHTRNGLTAAQAAEHILHEGADFCAIGIQLRAAKCFRHPGFVKTVLP